MNTAQFAPAEEQRCMSVRADNMACVTASSKNFVFAHDWHVMAYGTAYVLGCIKEGYAFLSLFPCIFMTPVHWKLSLEVCLREEVL